MYLHVDAYAVSVVCGCCWLVDLVGQAGEYTSTQNNFLFISLFFPQSFLKMRGESVYGRISHH